ncbi:MAG: penicillin-binding protein 2 [bacterium]|nr:penicillin-binding protein 2 [bacterium]
MPYLDNLKFNWRINTIFVVMAIFLLAIIYRLIDIQVINSQKYLALANSQQSRKFEIPAKRGEIFLEDNGQLYPIALNQSLKLLYADPKFIKDPTDVSKKLSPIIGIDEAKLTEALSNKNSRYVELKQKISKEDATRINALKIAGLVLRDKDYRYYTEGNLYSQVLGYVNNDGIGQYGIEGYLDSELAGTPGLLRAVTDSLGIPINSQDNTLLEARDGKSYILTIDRTVQSLADKAIVKAVQNNRAQSGSMIVMDPKTGEIIAMANYPNFDPNNYFEVKDYTLFKNSTITNLYEPGSGFKIFTMSAGLDSGKIKPETTYNDTGSVTVSGKTINNAENKKYGIQTMTDVIQKSLNTGAVFILQALGTDPNKITLAGKELLYEYIKKFGFGIKSGIEQPGEPDGFVKAPKTYDIDYANMTFGQGISITSIQMIIGAAAIANGGKLYQPHLVKKIVDKDKVAVLNKPKVIRDNVISPQTAATVASMMVRVVEHGSGYLTKTKGYNIAGKTGTAQVPKANGQGYEEDKNIGSFVGFAPVEDPKFIILVRVDYPKVQGFAEKTAVPAFAEVARELLKYYQIPPSN